jgi:DNA-binding PadR family transcriptional regulator
MVPPVFAHGALRLYLLALLEDGPKHGYEIIRALSERFGGTYSPSAGTVYPRLSKLEEEGLVATAPEGRRTVYSITDSGRAELAERRGELADVEEDISASVRRLADSLREELRASMRGLRADLAATAETARRSAQRSSGPPWGVGGSGGAGARPTDDGPAGRTPAAGRAEQVRENAGRLAEAEMLVQAFRDDLRIELRAHAAAHPITEITVEALRAALDSTRAAIRAALRL